MAAERNSFHWWRDLGRIGYDLKVIWEISVKSCFMTILDEIYNPRILALAANIPLAAGLSNRRPARARIPNYAEARFRLI